MCGDQVTVTLWTCTVTTWPGLGQRSAWTLWHRSSTPQDMDTSPAQECRMDMCLDFTWSPHRVRSWLRFSLGHG